ncbi:hypothetical protein HG535_0C04050 [Zygotorulaspora mrakii]|uniref:Transcription factor tau 91 kDa subunit n=1 Tax=Zygotorulaspora mrakii TaxID=42260 RepID=A0A7H9B0A6_ZYGMR|nr:uncharacterized protein HG535_0C04050 [Zygotorulaspora mrakii]QLG72051.1 hypothetical protein HG535_0C04050 [Zygotorulaspora mrakii]
MVVKRGRGRPRKVDVSGTDVHANIDPEESNLSIIATAVNEMARKRPTRRAASNGISHKSDDDDDYISIDVAEEGDNDFVPNELIAIDEEDEKNEVMDDSGPKRKTRGKQSCRNKSTIASSNSSTSSRLEKKRRKIRYLKDLSAARDKIERIYGINKQKLLSLAKVKEAFETCVFYFPPELLRKDSLYYVECTPPCAKKNVYDLVVVPNSSKVREIEEAELNEIFERRNKEVTIIIGEVEVTLGSGHKTEFPVFPNGDRRGFVYNTSCLITDMEWFNKEEEDDEYLAVSLSQYFDRPLNEKLQMFETETHVSCIDIFKLNTLTLEFSRIQTIAHTFGDTWNLKWHEGCQDINSLGTLAFTCQDGSVKLLEVNITEEYTIRFVEKPTISISLPKVSITCYDFLSPTTIVCGFKNGFVGAFDLTDSPIPSFYRKIHDSYVISICVAYSEFENSLVGTVSVDGFFYAFDPKDIFTSKTTIARFRGTNITPLSYIPQLYSFVNSDGLNSLKSVVPRASFGIHPICQQDTTITSIGTSRKHPLSLAGTADGNVVVSNVARRLLTGVKNGSSVHSSLRLWKWEYSDTENKYRLDNSYEKYVLALSEVSGIRIDPHGVNISCIKWNESSTGGNFYAFANNAGLLTVEQLGINS